VDVSAQWADTLLGLERLFFLKIALWGTLSVVTATALLAISRRRGGDTPVITAIAVVMASLGALELAIALFARQGAGLRDLGSATELDRGLRLAAGVALGWGSAASVAAWRSWRRARDGTDARIAGASAGIALHASAIALLALQLARAVVR
jgi:hypothetical protein